MGYTIHLIDRRRSITREVILEAFKLLPERLLGEWPTEQDWGWSYVTDIAVYENPDGYKYVTVFGSFSISGKRALDMVVSLQQILQHMGFQIEIFSIDFGFVNRRLYQWLGYDPDELKQLPTFIH